MAEDDALCGAQDVADYLGLKYMATYEMLKAGILPAKKIGNRYICSPRQLDAALLRPLGEALKGGKVKSASAA